MSRCDRKCGYSVLDDALLLHDNASPRWIDVMFDTASHGNAAERGEKECSERPQLSNDVKLLLLSVHRSNITYDSFHSDSSISTCYFVSFGIAKYGICKNMV